MHEEVEKEPEVEQHNSIVETKPSSSLVARNVFTSRVQCTSSFEILPFNAGIIKEIETEEAIAASDASKKDSFIAGYQIITDINKICMLENTMCHEKLGK